MRPDWPRWAGQIREGVTHFLFPGVKYDKAHEAAGQTLSWSLLCLSDHCDCPTIWLGENLGFTANPRL